LFKMLNQLPTEFLASLRPPRPLRFNFSAPSQQQRLGSQSIF
jgi:hypothetical protein